MGVFQPRYIFASELDQYGLPSSGSCDASNSKILGLVDSASIMIDEYCGRTDGDGNGSLVYTTYIERITNEAPGRNFFRLPQRPMVALTQTQVNTLSGQDIAASGYYYTGVQPSINTLANGQLSPIIAASGRYIPGRRDQYGYSGDPGAYINPLNTITLFGGPPPWNAIDMVNLDFNVLTGDVWVASGIYLYSYNEVIFTYNSGYNPANMPRQIKLACAAIVKNLIAKGGGTTGMTRFSSSKIGASAEFTEDVIDKNIQRMLTAFMTVRAT